MQRGSTLASIPDDVLYSIVAHLDAHTIRQLRTVSRYLNTFVSFIALRSLRVPLADENLPSYLPRLQAPTTNLLRCVQNLSIHMEGWWIRRFREHISIDAMTQSVCQMAHLRQLSLSWATSHVRDPATDTIMEQWQGRILEAAVGAAGGLEAVSIALPMDPDAWLPAALAQATSLRSLSLRFSFAKRHFPAPKQALSRPRAPSCRLVQVLEANAALENLEIIHCDSYSTAPFSGEDILYAVLPKLKSLSLKGVAFSPSPSPASDLALSKPVLPSLEHLQIQAPIGQTSHGIWELLHAAGHSSLQRIQTNHITPGSTRFLRSFTGLRQFSFASEPEHLDATGTCAAADVLQALEKHSASLEELLIDPVHTQHEHHRPCTAQWAYSSVAWRPSLMCMHALRDLRIRIPGVLLDERRSLGAVVRDVVCDVGEMAAVEVLTLFWTGAPECGVMWMDQRVDEWSVWEVVDEAVRGIAPKLRESLREVVFNRKRYEFALVVNKGEAPARGV